jgi:integrase
VVGQTCGSSGLGEILTSLPPGSCLASEKLDGETWFSYRDGDVATLLSPAGKAIVGVLVVSTKSSPTSCGRAMVVVEETAFRTPRGRLAKWAHHRGHLDQLPELRMPGARVLGHSDESARKSAFLVFTAKEIAAIIAKLPEFATVNSSGERFPVRTRFVVAWESSLRPATLAKLSVPENYRPGATALTITDEMDKNRFRRELPLSEAARKALDSICPGKGLIFGAHDFRTPLRAAARAAGIDDYRADRISDYDFRHSRLTHLGQVTSNLSGIMYLAGHRQPSTTAKYMRPQRAAAEEVLRAAAVAGDPELWRYSGGKSPGEKRDKTATRKVTQRTTDFSGLGDQIVELMGIEPTASRVRF